MEGGRGLLLGGRGGGCLPTARAPQPRALPPQALYRPHKLNVAAIGNIVSQLHVHVTGRLQTDPAWPGPCYGAVPPAPLAAPDLAVAMLRDAFKGANI